MPRDAKTPPWKRKRPAGKPRHQLSAAQRTLARNRARAAGRPYPNLVDNMYAATHGGGGGERTKAEKPAQARTPAQAPTREKAQKPQRGGAQKRAKAAERTSAAKRPKAAKRTSAPQHTKAQKRTV